MINELLTCKICGNTIKNLNVFSHHIKRHNLSVKEYLEYYLDLPLCEICKQNKVFIYSRPFKKYKILNRLHSLVCKKCFPIYMSVKQKEYWKNNINAREKARQNRIAYLKKHTGQSAWERRANNKMSYLEKWFYDNIILKYDLCKKYDIVNEYCEYPYFIDFAFTNIKLAVELDGKCHFINGNTRIEHDKIKDKHLIEKGWKIFRIKYNEINNIIDEFLQYLNNFQLKDKKLIENRLYKYNEIKKRHCSKNEYKQKLLYKLQEKNKPLINLIKNSNINFSKFGWVKQVAKLINKHPQKINAWMKKYMKDFYENNCYKRKTGLR